MRLTEEQRKLAADNAGLIGYCLQHYGLSDDYYGVAAIALCTATVTYKPGKRSKFSTWAVICICGAISNELRRCNYYEPKTIMLNDKAHIRSDFSALEATEFLEELQSQCSPYELAALDNLLDGTAPVSRQYRTHRMNLRKKARKLLESEDW